MKVFCGICKKQFATIPSRIKKGRGKYCSQPCYWISKKGKFTWNKYISGYKQPKISKAMKGRKASIETIEKMRIMRKGHWLGDKNPSWKGGITPINMALRNSNEYKTWRRQVFERDDYTCQICGIRGNTILHADHIKQFAYFPDLRFQIQNGRTLCKECHKKTDTYKKKMGRFIYA